MATGELPSALGARLPAGTEVAGGDGGRWRGRRSLAGTEVAGGVRTSGPLALDQHHRRSDRDERMDDTAIRAAPPHTLDRTERRLAEFDLLSRIAIEQPRHHDRRTFGNSLRLHRHRPSAATLRMSAMRR